MGYYFMPGYSIEDEIAKTYIASSGAINPLTLITLEAMLSMIEASDIDIRDELDIGDVDTQWDFYNDDEL
jgi:hypothetical protein